MMQYSNPLAAHITDALQKKRQEKSVKYIDRNP